VTTIYPTRASDRDRFVLERRGSRPRHDPWRFQGLIVEDERTEGGDIASVATVLLTGRECPWRCAMCDLWRFTTVTDTPPGAVPAQIRAARASLRFDRRVVSRMKLYNAGSFFDPRAVPEADYAAVAAALEGLSRVIVESHPALIGPRLDRFLAALQRRHGPLLEVAMGLETAHPAALERLNKRLTVEQFADAADGLKNRGISLRVFLLISPPFIASTQQDEWLIRSVDAAFDCGASAISLVPTRPGNGTLEALGRDEFVPPTLDDIERSLSIALERAKRRGRVFADVWDVDRFASCGHCRAQRSMRLHQMNLTQQILARDVCSACGSGVN
jgi:archaeosine synthase beta-subunit